MTVAVQKLSDATAEFRIFLLRVQWNSLLRLLWGTVDLNTILRNTLNIGILTRILLIWDQQEKPWATLNGNSIVYCYSFDNKSTFVLSDLSITGNWSVVLISTVQSVINLLNGKFLTVCVPRKNIDFSHLPWNNSQYHKLKSGHCLII